MNGLPPLVVIVGPTAAGKTDLGVMVAKRINGEVISGDSMQIYRYMDIGTAKPTPEEMDGIPHHMMDIITPDQGFSVARFKEMAESLAVEINGRGRIPVLAGGTGLYIRSVIDQYDFTPPGGDTVKRNELAGLAGLYGNSYLIDILKTADPDSAERIHPNDSRRLIRALEVYYATGRAISDFQKTSNDMPPKYSLVYYGLTMSRQRLYERIEKRVDMMISKGLVDEVKWLLKNGYGPGFSAMQALGYREIIDYLNGLQTFDEAVRLIKRNTRRFAKRQMTWFKRDNRIHWKNVENCNSLKEIAVEIASTAEGQFGKT